jgi:hypothetical protein
MLDSCLDGAHEQQSLTSIDGTFAELGDRHPPHICTREILVAEDDFHMVSLMHIFISLKSLA